MSTEQDRMEDLIRELSDQVIEPEYEVVPQRVEVQDMSTYTSPMIAPEMRDPSVLPIFSSDPNSDLYYLKYKSKDFHYILSNGLHVEFGSCSSNDQVQIKRIMIRDDYISNYDYYNLPFYVLGVRSLPISSDQISITSQVNTTNIELSQDSNNYDIILEDPGNDSDSCKSLLMDVFSVSEQEAQSLIESVPSKLSSYSSESSAQSLMTSIEQNEHYDPSMKFNFDSGFPSVSQSSTSQSQSSLKFTESFTANYVKYHIFTDLGEVFLTVDQNAVSYPISGTDLNLWLQDIINHTPIQSLEFVKYFGLLDSDFKFVRPNVIQIGNNYYSMKEGYTQFIDFYRLLTRLRFYKDHDRQNVFISNLMLVVYSVS